MKTLTAFILLVSSLSSWPTVTAGAGDCPDQFEGRVKEIIEPVGSIDAFSTNKVIFENRHTLRGEVSEKVFLDVLQNGPFTVEAEKEYRVQLRKGKLCWMEEI